MLFPFFALPVEMRLLVYHELLVSDDRFVLTWRGPQKVQKQQKKIYIGILQASKLCSIEGLAVLYGENVFDFENIRQRPSIADPILSRIGTTNPTLIRCIVAEHSAADEELTRTDGLLYEDRPHLVHYLRFSLDAFNISLDQLRVFAISIIPFGYDSSTTDIMRMKAPDLLEGSQLTLARVAWLDRRNARLNEVVDDICTREKNLRKVDYFKDVHSKISFDWSTPFAGRHWIAYKKS
ncbi:hypothetical protein B0J11DRAFT_523521 [Dendryphion nanum]|uniref:Uncharacterized protein n=1 Tax=Dendryphion nanum TaxID=256645 RepID=A0A9P9ITQ1_9PLEO|nr:hypothetical protein B0J11DRAFT_523521 [Dendryphion nanum]